MNRLHRWYCRSALWRRTLQERVPWILSGANLGSNVLEVGPGPGLTTDLLRLAAPRLTPIEIDATLAKSLGLRLRGGNVDVVRGDATAMPFPDARFSAAVSLTMLHHVPSPALQDRLLREVWRVIVPGGVFVGSDSLPGPFMRLIHAGDTLVPVNPHTFGARLETAGFQVVAIETGPAAFRFHACRPLST